MIFIVRAAIIALATFAGALVGFGEQSQLLQSYAAASKGMIGSVMGLDSSLLAIVLGLLIWTAHGEFTAQQAQLQTIGRALILLDLAFVRYGPKAAAGRRELRSILTRTRKRLWIDDPRGRRTLNYSEIANDVLPMRDALFSLHPADDDQRRHIAAAGEQFSTIVDTQLAMLRSLVNPMPNLLLTIVVGWACLLLFCYGLTSAINLLTTIMAALWALSVASAAYLILELSDPYVGLFRMPHDAFDGLIRTLTPAEHGGIGLNEALGAKPHRSACAGAKTGHSPMASLTGQIQL